MSTFYFWNSSNENTLVFHIVLQLICIDSIKNSILLIYIYIYIWHNLPYFSILLKCSLKGVPSWLSVFQSKLTPSQNMNFILLISSWLLLVLVAVLVLLNCDLLPNIPSQDLRTISRQLLPLPFAATFRTPTL